MKIAFLLPANAPGGGIFVVFEHARRLAARGHDVRIFFLRDTEPLQVTCYQGMQLVPTAHLKEAGQEAFDFAFATYWLTAYEIDRIPARRYGYLVQGDEENFLARWRLHERMFVRQTYREDFLLLATTPWLADMLMRRYGRQAHVVPVAVPVERFRGEPARYPKSDRLRVLVEGPSSQPFKRIGLAFSVLAELPDVEVFFVASDGLRQAGWRIDRFFSAVPYEQMPGIYASCDVLLKLSSRETFSMPVLEMFATGGTAVVSAFDGHDLYIRDRYNALVVPVDNRAAAVAALRSLLDQPALLATLKVGARESSNGFSWERSSEMLEAILKENMPEPDHKARLALLPRCRWLFRHRGVIGRLKSALRRRPSPA